MTTSDGDPPREDGQPVLEEYLPLLHAFVRLRAGKLILQNESVSDLVQSVCRQVLEHAHEHEFATDADFRRWLLTTAYRKIVNRYEFYRAAKRDARRLHSLSSADQKQLLKAYRSLHTPSQQAVAHESVERFEQAFGALPERYREIILLARMAGVPTADLARELKITEGAAWTLLSRALSRLATEIEKRNPEKRNPEQRNPS